MKIILADSVEKFIGQLEKPTIAKVLRTLDLLEEFGAGLDMPHNRAMGDGVLELRVRGKQSVRLFYGFRGGVVQVVQGYMKKTQATPRRVLELAKKRLDQI
ncbi:MAG: type II toxin-antitoxin system RelE/ParE family toxin [Patescibacteria group bacterium]|nr:type II toxin-antitoxin system RelE/ParE family toxin [Patescibacteria group bacterium]